MKDWLYIPTSPFQRNDDFIRELKRQFEAYFFHHTGVHLTASFGLVLDAYPGEEDDFIFADLIAPDNVGRPLNISWEFEKENQNARNFELKQGAVSFQFSRLPIEEIGRFLEANTALPFALKDYSFAVECFHFYDFKDLTFHFYLDKKATEKNLEEIRNSFLEVIKKWEKEKGENPENQVDFVGEIIENDFTGYKLFVDLGTADRNIVTLFLDALQQSPAVKWIQKVRIE